MPTILLVILILLVIGALPVYPYSAGWGYYPSGGAGLLGRPARLAPGRTHLGALP